MSAFTESRPGRRAQARTSPAALDFMRTTDAYSVTSTRSGDRCGMVAHRGVLHPSEFVDRGAALALVERHLGFTVEQVRSVYRQGPMAPEKRELRGQIDARLLALSDAGGNMVLLARVLGFYVGDNSTCKVIKDALSRARTAKEAA